MPVPKSKIVSSRVRRRGPTLPADRRQLLSHREDAQDFPSEASRKHAKVSSNALYFDSEQPDRGMSEHPSEITLASRSSQISVPYVIPSKRRRQSAVQGSTRKPIKPTVAPSYVDRARLAYKPELQRDLPVGAAEPDESVPLSLTMRATPTNAAQIVQPNPQASHDPTFEEAYANLRDDPRTRPYIRMAFLRGFEAGDLVREARQQDFRPPPGFTATPAPAPQVPPVPKRKRPSRLADHMDFPTNTQATALTRKTPPTAKTPSAVKLDLMEFPKARATAKTTLPAADTTCPAFSSQEPFGSHQGRGSEGTKAQAKATTVARSSIGRSSRWSCRHEGKPMTPGPPTFRDVFWSLNK